MINKQQALSRDAREFLAANHEIRVVFNTAGVLLGANHIFCRAVDRQPDDMIGRYCWNFIDPVCLDETLEVLNYVSLVGGTNDFINCYLTPSRRRIWLQWSCGKASPEGLLLASADVIEAPELWFAQAPVSKPAPMCFARI